MMVKREQEKATPEEIRQAFRVFDKVPAPTTETLKVSQSRSLAVSDWGTFWTSGEDFEPKFTHFCQFCSFVANHAPLT